MNYLVDANVLSEPTRRVPDAGVVHWLRSHEGEIAIDPIILGEVRYGILILPKSRRRDRLEGWFTSGIRHIRCIAWDIDTSEAWAQLLSRLRASGHAMPVKDSLIAATALLHDLTMVTRNRVDFQHAGIRIIDPFDPSL